MFYTKSHINCYEYNELKFYTNNRVKERVDKVGDASGFQCYSFALKDFSAAEARFFQKSLKRNSIFCH